MVAEISVQLPTGSAKITSGSCDRSLSITPTRSEKRQQKQPPVTSPLGIAVERRKLGIDESFALVVQNNRTAHDRVFPSSFAAASKSVVLPAPRNPPTTTTQGGASPVARFARGRKPEAVI